MGAGKKCISVLGTIFFFSLQVFVILVTRDPTIYYSVHVIRCRVDTIAA